MKKGIYESALDLVRLGVKKFGTAKALSEASGVSPANISHWLAGKRNPGLGDIAPILDLLNASLTIPDGSQSAVATKDVCFVDAQIVQAGKNLKPPLAEDYLAAPLVGEVGAGRGYIAQEDVESWFLVYRHVLPKPHSKDLFAVQIGPQSVSMQPTLNPGDIVLIDTAVQHVEAYLGRMMLVREPDKESGMIKRVELTPAKDDTLITFYSDNAARFRPMVYSLRDEYDGDLNNAIVGRVIWAWSDVRNK